MPLFSEMDVYRDIVPRRAALNMAIDEALLEHATRPTVRFYQWDHPALSFGYFGRYAEVAAHAPARDLVRRWTGGGIVMHGEDLTYSVIVPADDPAFNESSQTIYAAVHMALRDALQSKGARAELAVSRQPGGEEVGPCFANPGPADVMLEGKKIAGAAHRRTRRGLLHQGSVQNIGRPAAMIELFAEGLSGSTNPVELDQAVVRRATEIAALKYGTDTWLRRR